MWEQIFATANLIATIGWAVLILAPRKPVILKALFFGPVLLFALGYSVTIILLFAGYISAGNEGADFTTIAGVRSIFASDAGATIGWVHYLAFDLFVGIWIARNADARGLDTLGGRMIQAPVLFLTFMAGPLGLSLYLILRFILGKQGENRLLPG
ncbi:MAG: ABA4-like family protein [Blastomonas sp.]